MGVFFGVLAKDTVAVVHVNEERARDGDLSLFGDFFGFFESMVHPNLGDEDHET